MPESLPSGEAGTSPGRFSRPVRSVAHALALALALAGTRDQEASRGPQSGLPSSRLLSGEEGQGRRKPRLTMRFPAPLQ